MNAEAKIVISASRRTDIPAFYMPWFMEGIAKGFFEVINPFNQRVRKVAATVQKVHTLVFWSKDFNLFLKEGYGQKLQQLGYNLFFNFSINSESRLLEPYVPPLKKRLEQLDLLSTQFGAEAINWRFDPICFYQHQNGHPMDNIGDFARIADRVADFGITRCVSSFMDHYKKIDKRVADHPGLRFIAPPMKQKVSTVLALEKLLAAAGIQLTLCCEKEVLAALPPYSTVKASACVPNDLFLKLYGGHLSLRKDSGQRTKAGCGCKVSVDIGSYTNHPCFHNCLFCYANPAGRRG